MRHFLEILRASLLKGAGFRELAPQLSALGAIGAVIFTSAILRFRKQGL
jgi:ABC-2 type transport system permease protein